MKTVKSFVLILALGLFLGTGFWPLNANAVFYLKPYSDDINAIGIQVTAAPGVTTKGYIYLANEDEGDDQWYEVYAVDAELRADGSYGGLNSEKNVQKQVGLWTKLESNKVQIDNAKMKLLTVTVTIPEDVKPGKYQGGIVATKFAEEVGAATQSTSNGASVKTIIRNGASIYLTVVPKDQYVPLEEEVEVKVESTPAGTTLGTKSSKIGFNKLNYAIGGGIIALVAIILAALKYFKKS